MPQRFTISSFGLLTVTIFLIFSLLARFIFPFGDEPDFLVRVPHLVNTESHPLWSPYQWLQPITSHLETHTSCEITSTTFSVWAQINYHSCNQSIQQVLLRWLILCLLMTPILYILVFRNTFISFIKVWGINLSRKEWMNRLNALSITLFFPSMVYYLGLISVEQFTLILSLMVFLVFESWILVFLLMSIMFSIDFGNSLVVAFFFLFTNLSIILSKKGGIKMVLLTSTLFVLGAYIIGFTFLGQLQSIPFLREKSEAIYLSLDNSDKVNKYPIFLRPIITFMSFIFLTPSFIKTIFTYVLCGIAFVLGIRKLAKYHYSSNKVRILTKELGKNTPPQLDVSIVKFICAITSILFFVFLMPTYANAKYYIFLLPFIFTVFLKVYKRNHTTLFVLLCTLSVFINILLYINF